MCVCVCVCVCKLLMSLINKLLPELIQFNAFSGGRLRIR